MATSIDAVSSDKLEALLQCSICLEALNNPRTLPCFHSYCKCCLERFVNNIRQNKPGADLQCPFCRSEFTLGQEGVEGMTQNHFICNMLEVMAVQDRVKGIPCSHCQKPSVGRCVTCEVFMCEKCFQPHNSYPGFRDHSVLTMEELSKHENRSKITGSSYCKEHKSKKLKFFCETCEQLICRYCMDFDHLRHNHMCLPLDKVVAQKTDALKVCCETLGRNLNESNEALQDLRNVAISLQQNAKQAKNGVRQQQKDILTAVERMLDKQVETVIDVIDTTFNNKHEAIVEQIKEVEIYVNKVKSFVDVSNSLLENGNGEEIVSSQKMINDNSEMLKTERLKHIGQTKHDDTISYTRQPIDDLQIEELLEKVGTVHDAVHPSDAVHQNDPFEKKTEKKRKENEKQELFGRNQSGQRDENRSPNSAWKEKPSDQRTTDVPRKTTQPASPSYPSTQSPPRSNQGQGPPRQDQFYPSQVQSPSNQGQHRPNQGQGPPREGQFYPSQVQSPSNQGQGPPRQGQGPPRQSQLHSSQVQRPSNRGQSPPRQGQPGSCKACDSFSESQPIPYLDPTARNEVRIHRKGFFLNNPCKHLK